MYNHNKAQQSKNHVHISWDILYYLARAWNQAKWVVLILILHQRVWFLECWNGPSIVGPQICGHCVTIHYNISQYIFFSETLKPEQVDGDNVNLWSMGPTRYRRMDNQNHEMDHVPLCHRHLIVSFNALLHSYVTYCSITWTCIYAWNQILLQTPTLESKSLCVTVNSVN